MFDTRNETEIDDTPRSAIPGVLRSSTVGDDYIFKYYMRIIPFLKKTKSS
ncbi:MAG: hypothetical protein LBC27_01190 [Spirochaetaceae bacterium]|nr:hypothetical protein [Spirochaetaceae bacterium]